VIERTGELSQIGGLRGKRFMIENIRAEARPITEQWVVSAFAVVSWRSGRVAIISATSGATLVADTINLLALIHAFAVPHTVEEVVHEFSGFEPEQTTASINDLISCQILTPASRPEEATTNHWDWSSLAFHRRSRQPGFQMSPVQATPAIAPRRSSEAIRLTRGSVETAGDLASIMDRRRSCRSWPTTPIRRETFSEFLWLSARNRDISGEEAYDEYVSRPYPSGGAAYSLEIYPVISPKAVESITAGVYRYLPDCHYLEPVSMQSGEYLPFLEAAGLSAGSSSPPIVLIITSRFARQSESYGNLAYSLVLKEVGCLFQTMYLVGEFLGLGACALGGGAPDQHFARICHTSDLAEPVVGEFMLGPR
jgi:SagB-type dehydrogenase family enzyme